MTPASQQFTAGSLTATSSAINVSPATASKLAIIAQPSSSASAGTPFVAQPQVSVSDPYGNIVSSDGTTVTAAETSGGYGTRALVSSRGHL